MRKTPRGWIQIGESRTRGVARIPLGLKPSRDSRATSQRDSPIWIQPLGVFRYKLHGYQPDEQGCQPDEPQASLATTNRCNHVYVVLFFLLLFMYVVIHCLYSVGNKITTTITTHRICGMWLLIHDFDNCFWCKIPLTEWWNPVNRTPHM